MAAYGWFAVKGKETDIFVNKPLSGCRFEYKDEPPLQDAVDFGVAELSTGCCDVVHIGRFHRG